MATNANKKEYVEIFVPRIAGNGDPNLVIAVNGKNYLLPRGKTSSVPKAVAKEFERSQRAQRAADNASYQMVEETMRQAAAAGIK